jgi:hypothetical protein
MLTSHEQTTEMSSTKKETPKPENIDDKNAEIVKEITEEGQDARDSERSQEEAEVELSGRAVEVPVLMDEGKSAYKAQNWEDAVSKFGEASSILYVFGKEN